MAGEAYYIRSRGKISGPFDLGGLQKQVRRGSLSRMHEVSSDRISWASAGDFGELFSARAANVEASAEHSPSPVTQSTATVATAKYFYVQNGITVGPVPLPVLVSLTQNGTLRSEDFCWQEGSEMALPASHLPALAAVFSAGTSRVGVGHQPVSPSQNDRMRAHQILDSTHGICQITGVVSGFALLLFLNLPMGTIRDKAIWWWDSFKSADAQSVVVLCFFVLLAGLTAASVGIFVKGLIRAWIFLGLSALSLILIFVALQNMLSSGPELFFSLMVFYFAAALMGTSYFRSKAPDAKLGMIFQPIFGGGLLLSVLILTVLGLARNPAAQNELFGRESLPGWAVLVIAIAVIGTVSASVSGILGLVGMRRQISTNLCRSTLGFAIASVGMPILAAMIWVCEFVNSADVDQKGMWIFVAFRICLIFCAFLALMTAGLIEIFVSITLPNTLGASRSTSW